MAKTFRWTKVDKSAPSARADFTKQWILRLVDPASRQTKSVLMRLNGSACCLGIACEVAKIPKVERVTDDVYIFDNHNEGHLPQRLIDFLRTLDEEVKIDSDKLPKEKVSHAEDSLVGANDGGWTFLRIAKFIRDYPAAIFQDLTASEEAYIMAVQIPTREQQRAQRHLLRGTSPEAQTPQIQNPKT